MAKIRNDDCLDGIIGMASVSGSGCLPAPVLNDGIVCLIAATPRIFVGEIHAFPRNPPPSPCTPSPFRASHKDRLPDSGDEFDRASAALPGLFHSFRRVAPVYRFVLARTICNAWVTSARVRGVTASCKCCGGGQDGVVHYLSCDVLRTAIEHRTQIARAPSVVSRMALFRAGAAYPKCTRYRPPPANLWQLAIAADVVHKAASVTAPRGALASLVRDAVRRHKLQLLVSRVSSLYL